MNRRAQVEMMEEWFPRIILLIVATVIIVVIVNYYTNRDVDSVDTELAANYYRVYYDNIIMYSDSATGRVYPGVIDANLFKDESLTKVFNDKSLTTKELRVGICLTLTQNSGTKTICSDKGMVDHYVPMAQSGINGGQGAKMLNITIPVAVRDGTKTTSGILNAIVVRSNT